MSRAHHGHVRPRKSQAGPDRPFSPAPEPPVPRPTTVHGIPLQRAIKKRGRCIGNLNVGEDQWMNSEAPDVGQRLMKLRSSPKSRIRLVLRISPIDSADIPAVNFERGDPVFLSVSCECRQLIKAMNDCILAVRQNSGLPRILLTQPTAGTRDGEILIEPGAID